VLRFATIVFLSITTAVAADDLQWSLMPLNRNAGQDASIDSFVIAKLKDAGLAMSPPAERRVWLRRVTFDLIGLPPSPEELTAFLSDASPGAEARVVDRLLASPRYGERWARHWMDVARYAETHGHDEDAIRENAWPYRDWLIHAFNQDMPYAQFVREQVAGDVISPDDPQAVAATGFLACGPWDSSSQQGIQDGTIDKKIAQYLDRDDMLSATMSTFTSTTVHCARCHHHKFDPVTLEDYYALQAVFAGVDKVERPFDQDAGVAGERVRLLDLKRQLDAGSIPADLKMLEPEQTRWERMVPAEIFSSSGVAFQIQPDASVLFTGSAPLEDTYTIAGSVKMKRITAVRVEVLSDASLPFNGPGRAENGNLHLSEVSVRVNGTPVAIARAVADFNQASWEIDKAIDGKPETAWGIHPEEGKSHRAVFVFAEAVDMPEGAKVEVVLAQVHGRNHVIGRTRISVSDDANPHPGSDLEDILNIPEAERTDAQKLALAQAALKEQIDALPKAGKVFAVASEFTAVGNFKPAIQPREVFVLSRGDIFSPKEAAKAGTISAIPNLPSRFDLADPGNEGARRAALAEWLTHPDNVLTWRSIVNRVWHYHFGRGIASTPNDFGKMGADPTHPELLDWLATGFYEHDGSLKWLHREIVLSATYRQASDDRADGAAADIDNKLLWRMNRQPLDAECIHDAVLCLSGKMDLTMGGPSARQFHASKGVHVTPNLDYLGFDPDDPANFRRSVYRFVFRTVPDPLMQALNCPDASQAAPSRESAATAVQALALLNNRFLVRQSEHMAANLKTVDALFLSAYGRPPTVEEKESVSAYANEHGLANACRVIINSSEFLFVK
jgi:hypothetical protein